MLAEKTNKIIEEINGLKELMVKKIGNDMLNGMDETEAVAMTKMFKLMNLTMDLAKEQAMTMDSINAKLDKLLERTEKGSN